MTILRNALVVTPDDVLEDHELVLSGDTIVSIAPSGTTTQKDAQVFDCAGGWLMPGFIDIHADYIEHMAAPRPNAMMDLGIALHEAEREFLTHGITTMFHSLSFYGRKDFSTNPIRSPEATRALTRYITDSHTKSHLVHHRFHARFEIDSVSRVDELRAYIEEGMVHLVSFMDHTPGQGQYRDLEMYRHILKGYRDLSDQDIDTIIAESKQKQTVSAQLLMSLSEAAQKKGIAIASHDDDSQQKIELVRGLGATISEFPITMDVAKAASALGMHTVAGAPNVLKGGSHAGNLSATEAILEGCVDILCSDYYPPALLHAVFRLYNQHGLNLSQAVKLVTLNPAQAVGMQAGYGSLEAGKKADVLLVRVLEDQTPVVTDAWLAGQKSMGFRYRT